MPWKQPSSQTFIKRVVGLPGDHLSIRNGHVIRNGKRGVRHLHRPVRRRRGLQLPADDHGPAWRLLHDGRQPARFGGQPLLGPGAASVDHRQGVPDLLAARSDRLPLVSIAWADQALTALERSDEGADRAGGHGGGRGGARAADPGVHRQALPDPEPLDGPDARRRPAGADQSAGRQPQRRRHRGVPSAPRGRLRQPVCGDPNQGGRAGTPQACDKPTPQESSQTFIKRVVGGPGDTISIVNGHVYPQRRAREGLLHRSSAADTPACNFRQTDQDSARRLLHDGRQPWRFGRQPILGPGPETNGSSVSLSSPTGRRTGSASSNAARTARRKSRIRAARRLFRFDRALGVRFVAGADEAGRGCLAGPLVAAAVLFDLERDRPRRGPRARSARTTPSSRPPRRAPSCSR